MKVPPWLSPRWLVLQRKTIQFGILIYLKAKEINLWDNLQGSKCDILCIFLWELFSYYENIPTPLDPVGCFEIFLPKHPVMFSTDLHYSLICSVTKKACIFAIKKDSSPKTFLEVTKGIDHLQQNALEKLRFSDSDSEQV